MSGRLGLVTSACRALARLPLQRSCAMAAHLTTLPRAACNQVAARQPASPCLAAHPVAAAAALPPCHRRGFVAAAASSGPSSSSSLSSSWNSSSRPCSARRMHDWRAAAAGGGAAAEAAPQLAAPPQTKTSGAYGMQLPAGGKRMILTDAMALLYRSHYAFSDAHRLRNAAGDDTTVLFGFLSTLLNLLELVPPPTHFAVVFDARGKTFRHEMYEGYKGQRAACPDAVKEAIPRLQRLLDAMAIPYIQVPGVEADDVIGTMAFRAVQEGFAVAVASPDKDFFQLLRPGIILLRPPKKPAPGERVNKYALVPYSTADFEQEFGLQPQQFVDVLALAGDSSDNVPGVSGIGPKTAVSLLKEHGSLAALLDVAAAGEIKPKKAAATLASEEGRAAALLSQQLVRIETGLDLPPVQEPLANLRLRLPADRGAELLQQFGGLEFTKHAARVKALWASELYR